MAAASGRRERWTAGRRSTSPCNARTERHPMTDRAILLVEDNPDDEALTLRAFKKHNITNHVVVAHDGAEALEYLFGTGRYAGRDMALTPQLILLDLKLPKVDGLEVLRQLRADDRTRLLPDRKSTRLNSSHGYISYAVFCLK